ncbi:MAG: proline-rich domain-containing protein [Nanobdellota archaeon]
MGNPEWNGQYREYQGPRHVPPSQYAPHYPPQYPSSNAPAQPSHYPPQYPQYAQYPQYPPHASQASPQQSVPSPENHEAMKKAGRSLKHWAEDIFVIILILLNILDFLEVLPGDLDILKKILSWVMLGYLMYHVNLAKLIFGKDTHEDIHGHSIGLKPRDIDLLIILSYFLLIFKNMTHFARVVEEEVAHGALELTSFGHAFVSALSENAMQISSATFFFGGLFLIAIALFMALRYDIKAPSIMSIIHEEGPPSRSIGQTITRFVTSFIILCGFYVVVFNFFMEWLAFAVDAPLLVFGLFFYLFLIVRMKKHLDAESFLHKVGSFGEGFYEKFLELFYTKRGLILGVTGMLVLHLLTDVGNFLVPYILGIHDALYFSSLDAALHHDFLHLLSSQISGMGLLDSLVLVLVYVFNVIGALCVALAPGYLWMKMYKGESPSIPGWMLGLFFMSLIVLFIAPIMWMTSISEGGLAGVDIQSRAAEADMGFLAVLLVAGACAVVMWGLSKMNKQAVVLLGITCVNLFFLWYVKLFSFDVAQQYLDQLSSLLTQASVVGYISYFYMLVFMGITVMFYALGFLLYAWNSYSVNYLNAGSDMVSR